MNVLSLFDGMSCGQLAFDDPRSKLFFVYLDILNHIKAQWYVPKWNIPFKALNPGVKFLLENVKMKKEYLDIITERLGVEPVFINSALVSAQNRQRYYWCNWKVEQPEDKGIMLADILENGVVDRDKSYCIDANYHKGGNPRQYFEKSRRQLVFTDNGYRKLTPTECERLQTVPDNYTNHVSNTQRYKMLGNGWTVDVIAHIFKSLKRIER